MLGLVPRPHEALIVSLRTTELHRENNKDVTFIDSYFKDIMHRDVITRHQIRNTKEIRELCLYLITNSGSLLSYESLWKMLQVKSVSTIRS